MAALPKQVDLRPRFRAYGLPPGAQGNRGTCSLFALVGVLEFEYARARRGKGERLSVEYLNWASHRTNGRKQDGSFFSDALEGMRRHGICRDDLLTYAGAYDADLAPPAPAQEDARTRTRVTAAWIKEWDVKTGLTDAHLRAIRKSLAEGHPIAVGLRWPKRAVYSGPDHRMNTPPPEEVFDGHSIVLVGYADDPGSPGGGVFLFRNASGPEWGEGGYARFTYAYALAYANDAVTLRVT